MRVQEGFKIAAFLVAIRFFHGEEAVEQADFGGQRVRGGDPVDGAFDFATGGCAAARPNDCAVRGGAL